MKTPEVTSFFDETTNTFSYVVSDPETGHCAVIDSVLNYDPDAARISQGSADEIIEFIQTNRLNLKWILDTHVHADHLTASDYIQQKLGGKTAVGSHIVKVQELFGDLFNLKPDFLANGHQFDVLLDDQAGFELGQLRGTVLHTPGHTPACVTYQIGDALFVGDTVFMPDFGTARCDFPGGDAQQLFQSIQKIFTLPDPTRMFLCHDYKAPGRDHYQNETTVGEQKIHNIHVNQNINEAEFVNMRRERDSKLSVPKLLLPSVQINIQAGKLPPKEDNGNQYIKLPINIF